MSSELRKHLDGSPAIMGPLDPWHVPPDAQLFRVRTGGIDGGIVVRSGYVIESHPALREFMGKLWTTACAEFAKRRWRLEFIKNGSRR